MNKILFIDTVTTGMDPKRCAIYKLGGIYVEGNREKTRFDFHIHPFPDARIIDSSLWISGETRSSLLAYPDEKEAFKDILDYLNTLVSWKTRDDKLYLAGYNASAFDYVYIRELFKRQGVAHFSNYFHYQVIDLMSIAAFALMDKRTSMPDFSLESVAKYIGVEPTINKDYSCIDNAETCLKIYNRIKRDFNITSEDIEFGMPGIETVKNF